MNPELCELLSRGGLVTCYLADENGIRLDPFDPGTSICEEVETPEGRENVRVTLPDGEETTLQKVFIKKTGFIVVEVRLGDENCISDPIPFCNIESALLCAPEGTEIICQVREFSCSACIDCQNGFYQGVEIFLDICQDIQVVFDTVVELSGRFCQPREGIDLGLCPREAPLLPPQCNFDERGSSRDDSDDVQIKQENELVHVNQIQQETVCVNSQKVYDWIVKQTKLHIVRKADEIPFICNCTLGLFVPAAIVCENNISGTVECDGVRVSGAAITFTSSSDAVTFAPNPAFTDENGHFFTTAFVEVGTPPTDVTITASTNVNGQELSVSLPTLARCSAPCILTLASTDTIECNGAVNGRVRCGGDPVPGVTVTLTSDPAILTFDPNPVITGDVGGYISAVTVPEGTPPTEVEITATALVDGQMLMETIIVTVECEEQECELTLSADPLITCEGTVTGIVTCNGDPQAGVEVDFSIFPLVGMFDPDPAVTLADGSFSTTLTIPEGTPFLNTLITASAFVNGESLETSIGVQVECPAPECPCKFRIGVEGGAAGAFVDITQDGMAQTLFGTINVTAVQCFTASPMCNPAVDNFNITFGSGGTNINFLNGRRFTIECEDNNFARVHGLARATGLFSGNFDVLIELSVSPGGLGTWSIFATNFAGETFSTTFTAQISPVTFIGDCEETP